MKFIQHNLFAILNFIVFVVLLWALLRKQVRVFLSSRRERFRMSMEEARRRRRLADNRLEKCERRLQRLEQEVAELLRAMEEQGKKERAAVVSAAEEKAERMIADAERKVEHERQKLRHDLYRRTVERAIMMAEEELRKKLKGDEAVAFMHRSVDMISREVDLERGDERGASV